MNVLMKKWKSHLNLCFSIVSILIHCYSDISLFAALLQRKHVVDNTTLNLRIHHSIGIYSNSMSATTHNPHSTLNSLIIPLFYFLKRLFACHPIASSRPKAVAQSTQRRFLCSLSFPKKHQSTEDQHFRERRQLS